tara:strand:+ start:752 stop:1066 length:315 start_codon:yes stop_codon:yes gene_type:complete
MSNTVTIDLANNHLAGMFVQTRPEVIDASIAELKSSGMSKMQIRKLASVLKQQSRTFAQTIAAGGTFFDGVETIDRVKFDADLVWVAVYDNVGNNKPIVTTTIN